MKKLFPVLVLALLVLAGCYPGSPITITGQVPVIESFNASPASISAGESSSLSWTVSGATQVTIDQGIGNVALTGSRTVSPASTTVYTMTATNSSGSATATTEVMVTGSVTPPTPAGLPTINSFTATPSVISLGDSTNLTWSVSNATSVSINHGVGTVGPSGNTFVSPPTTTTYTLTATNASGSLSAAALVQVSGMPSPSSGLPVINYFNASPPIISSIGGSSLLRWNTSNATSVTIDNGIGPVASHGTLVVSPPSTVVYTLTAANGYGYVTQTLLVQVAGSPSPPSFAVTGVTASVSQPSFSGPCPYQFNFSAIITTNGSGTVTYQWERSDGASSSPQTVYFGSASSVVVTDYWFLGASYGGWERVRILSPNSMQSNEAVFNLNCL
jgi:hypothetical protein